MTDNRVVKGHERENMMKSVTIISSEYDLAVTVLVGQTMQAELYFIRS